MHLHFLTFLTFRFQIILMRSRLTVTILILAANLYSQTKQVPESLCFLALGDSYTIGESVSPDERWPVQLAEEFSKHPGIDSVEVNIIAKTGWTTGDLLEGISRQIDTARTYDLVSLLIGVNNQYQHLPFELYEPQFRRLLEKAIATAGGQKEKVFIVSIPDYAYTPSFRGHQKISDEIDKYNRLNREIAAEYGIGYVDVTPVSRQGLEKTEYVAQDDLHPSAAQYAEWVMLMIEKLGQ